METATQTVTDRTEFQNSIVKSLPRLPHGRLIVPPRVGKTRIALKIIQRDKPARVLWITPSKRLFSQVASEWNLLDNSVKGLVKMDSVSSKDTVIHFSTWMSLNRHKNSMTYDYIVMDEEQYITSVNSSWLKAYKVPILTMTGTKTKDLSKLKIFRTLSLQILHESTLEEAVTEGFISDYSVKVVDVEPSHEKLKEVSNIRCSFRTSDYSEYQAISRKFDLALRLGKGTKQAALLRKKIVAEFHAKQLALDFLFSLLKGQRNVFFCATCEQADKLDSVHAYHSKNKSDALTNFLALKSDTLVLVNVGGTGTTYKQVDNLVILQADSNINGYTVQKICRSLLQQGSYKAKIWIVRALKTQDTVWVAKTLEGFDPAKIEYLDFTGNELKSKSKTQG